MNNQIKQKIGVLIQARMGSTRLPYKVLLNLDENEKVLDLLIERLKLSKLIDEIIIATTPDKKNSLIVDVAKVHNVSYFIGSEENVLKRYYKASKKFKLNIIIRATADNPFLDPRILDEIIAFFKKNEYDYIKTLNLPIGLNVEIFSFETLKKVYNLAKSKPDKEHVTYFIYTHPDFFKIYYYIFENFKNIENLRLTIDEKDDLIMCREIYKRLKEKGKELDFSTYDIVEIIEKNPELININKHVNQKAV